MLTKIFPTYIWVDNISNIINLNSLNNLINSIEDWNYIKTRNNRDDIEFTDKFGKLWDNITISDYPELEVTFNVLQNNIEQYYKSINCNLESCIDSAWVHEYNENQAIGIHNHRGAQTVGVLYLQNFEQGGNIEFTDPKEYLLQIEPEGIRKEEIFSYNPKVGDIIFFPGYLKHNSTPGYNGKRRVLGFHFYAKEQQ